MFSSNKILTLPVTVLFFTFTSSLALAQSLPTTCPKYAELTQSSYSQVNCPPGWTCEMVPESSLAYQSNTAIGFIGINSHPTGLTISDPRRSVRCHYERLNQLGERFPRPFLILEYIYPAGITICPVSKKAWALQTDRDGEWFSVKEALAKVDEQQLPWVLSKEPCEKWMVDGS